ncbi:Putative peptidoglycan binding domain-containing protein [Polaribacter sp. KT25b]|uniref:peptidoglycan-binding domain-containing protein n=1 Tax=Polaribacter sp. KT25b TaxID=1855336 RepID=UPI00087BAFC3|nr:peptidoglycan-binding domain-containing protein [Polaribacter sp. KT25b]SDS07368.1 Putative peptidoglycan binding domain-containing protein [Polaribacter sp. KT25b]
MKQLIIFILIIIAGLIGYGKYNQYKRYNSPQINYKTDKKLDISYHNQDLVLRYYEAVENLDSFTMLQWSANNIDVRTPEDDDDATKNAVNTYAKKLAKVNYYEMILENSLQLKEKGLSNNEIKFIEENGIDLASYKKEVNFKIIKNLFDPKVNLYKGEKNAIIFEVQKRLNDLGSNIKIDGVYRTETLEAIKNFEEKNNLLADGFIDELTLELMFK